MCGKGHAVLPAAVAMMSRRQRSYPSAPHHRSHTNVYQLRRITRYCHLIERQRIHHLVSRRNSLHRERVHIYPRSRGNALNETLGSKLIK